MKLNGYILCFIAGFIISAFILKSCNNEDIKIIKKKTVNIERIKDSITEVVIKNVKPIYKDTVITKTKKVFIKGEDVVIVKDTTVYVTNNDENGQNLNSYDVLLKTEESTADLKINVLGTLKSVTGTIDYPKITNTEIITKKIPVSSNYIFLKSNIDRPFNNFDLGYIRTFKSRFLLIGSITYDQRLNPLNQTPISLNVGFGIKF